jgi:hypothetical protein
MLPAFLALLLNLEMGYMPLDTWRGYTPGFYVDRGVDIPLYADVSFRLDILDLVFVGGSVRTEMTMINASRFSPHLMNYGFTVGIHYQGFEVGFRHHCLHPIVPYMTAQSGFSLGFEGAYEELYIKFEGKLTIIK